jgi:hypothetical protein
MKSKIVRILVVLGLIFSFAVSAAYARGNVAAQTWSRSGLFAVIWGDSFDGATTEIYTLTDDSGQTTVLLLDAKLVQPLGGVLALDGKYVSVQGVLSPSLARQSASTPITVTSIALASTTGANIPSINGGGGGGGGGAPPKPVGNAPWITIMCKFPDDPIEPNDLAYFQGMYSSTKPGLDHYWREVSYDIVNLVGSNAAGWFTLPHPKVYYNPTAIAGGTDLNLLATDCANAADPSVDFSLYQTGGINMAFNFDIDYGWSYGAFTVLTLDGISQPWRNTWLPPWGVANVSLVEHEMGHGWGLPHSSGAYGFTYDNVWDVMSADRYNCPASTDPIYGCMGQHAISYHKDLIGWLPPAQKFTAGPATNTTITMEQLALPTTGNYLMAEIPIGGSSTHFFTVEVRRQIGYDVKLPGNAVVIHDVDTLRLNGNRANVIDADGNGNTADAGAMWEVGETFFDAANNIFVSVVSATPTGFVVNIINGIADVTPPVLNLPADFSVPQTLPAGAVVTYSASATDAVGPANPVVTCVPASGSIFPVGMTTVNCSASDVAGNTANGSFHVTVTPSVQLLINPGFDQFTVLPKAWTYSVLSKPISSLSDCTLFFLSPNCSLRLVGERSTRVVTQTISQPGLAGEKYSFGLSSRALNIPDGGTYKVEVSFFNRFNRVMLTQTLNFTNGTHDFETVSGNFTVPAAYTKIVFRFYLQKGSGVAWFDDAFLLRIP